MEENKLIYTDLFRQYTQLVGETLMHRQYQRYLFGLDGPFCAAGNMQRKKIAGACRQLHLSRVSSKACVGDSKSVHAQTFEQRFRT